MLRTHESGTLRAGDVGTTVTLGVAAWWAARPTLERLLAAQRGPVTP